MLRSKLGICLAAFAGTVLGLSQAQAQTAVGQSITYQGHLDDAGQPANGVYDFEFRPAYAATGSTYVGFAQFLEDVSVVNGLFTVKINLGLTVTGDARFMEVSVRPGASTGAYTILSPRQEMTPAPYAMGLALPMSEAQSSASPLISLDQNGSGNCVYLTSTSSDCLNVMTDGTGDALYAHTTGAGGIAVNATTTGAGSTAVYAQTNAGGIPLYGYNLGTTGNACYLRSENVSNTANVLEVQSNSTGTAVHASSPSGMAAYFQNTSTSNTASTLRSDCAGSGLAVWGRNSGTGGAGRFDVTNASSNANALEVQNFGHGLSGKFTGGDVQIWGNLYAETGTVLNRATPVAWGRMSYSGTTPTLISSSGNVALSYVSGSGFKVQVVGESNSGNWVVVTSVSYGAGVSTDHHWSGRTSYPAPDGSFFLNGDCIGCAEFTNDAITYSFVVYQGS